MSRALEFVGKFCYDNAIIFTEEETTSLELLFKQFALDAIHDSSIQKECFAILDSNEEVENE